MRGRRSYPCGAPLRRNAVRDAAPREATEKNRRKKRKASTPYRSFPFYVEKSIDREKISTRDWHSRAARSTSLNSASVNSLPQTKRPPLLVSVYSLPAITAYSGLLSGFLLLSPPQQPCSPTTPHQQKSGASGHPAARPAWVFNVRVQDGIVPSEDYASSSGVMAPVSSYSSSPARMSSA
jgi:hypothetical protein